MAVVDESPADLAEASGINVNASADYLSSMFLNKEHYSTIHQSLSEKWDRLQSLSAAMKLMEKYGVKIDKAEEDELSRLEESQQIERLVMKMPQQSKDEFQQFFLQLQVLVSSAMKVRQALESGRPDDVERTLDDADNTGISPYVLRMAIVQAGTEVSTMRKRSKAWGKDMDAKMSKKIRGQEDAIAAQKKLKTAQTQLSLFTTGQNSKSKKVVMNFLNNSSEGLKAACFKGWFQAVKQDKFEKGVAGEYRERIERAEAMLLDMKTKNLEGVRGMMKHRAEALTSTLIRETLDIWIREVFEWKKDKEMQEEMAELNAALAGAKASQKAKSRSVMARMSNDTEAGLMSMTLACWVTFHLDYQKTKELEDQVKHKEQMIKEYMKGKSDSAKKVLQASVGATDTGLMQMVIQTWVEVLQEAKEEARMAEILSGANSKFQTIGSAGKLNGMNAMQKATYYIEQLAVIRTWNAWKLDTRMESTLRTYHGKIEAKRKQLVGVQEMFRSFANELESGLKKSAESTRGEQPAILKGRGLAKSDSLPDINQKLSSGRKAQPQSYARDERQAMSRSQGQQRQHRPEGSDREHRERSRYGHSPQAAAYPAGAAYPAPNEQVPGAPRAAWN